MNFAQLCPRLITTNSHPLKNPNLQTPASKNPPLPQPRERGQSSARVSGPACPTAHLRRGGPAAGHASNSSRARGRFSRAAPFPPAGNQSCNRRLGRPCAPRPYLQPAPAAPLAGRGRLRARTLSRTRTHAPRAKAEAYKRQMRELNAKARGRAPGRFIIGGGPIGGRGERNSFFRAGASAN